MLVSAFDLITLWQWENLKFDPPTTRKWPNRSPSNFARVTTSGSPTIMQNFITMRSGVFDPRIREILFFITDRKAGIKITFVSLFLVPSPRRGDSVRRLPSNLAGRRRPPAPYSLPKLKIFRGHLGNFGPENVKKNCVIT